jgi:RND superfamily putative drug exporter
MFSVLFGLSMDYEVYLISRIQEEWHHLVRAEGRRSLGVKRAAWRNHQAIVIGQAKSGRIIAAAAAIIILVFGSFMLGGQRSLQEFGFGLGFSVLVDAMIIRSLLVPAIMHIIGPANWSMPSWLSRVLPDISVEVADQASSGERGEGASVPESPATVR